MHHPWFLKCYHSIHSYRQILLIAHFSTSVMIRLTINIRCSHFQCIDKNHAYNTYTIIIHIMYKQYPILQHTYSNQSYTLYTITRLEEDMSSVDREVTPWVIFGGHRAMYVNSGYGGNKSSSTYAI